MTYETIRCATGLMFPRNITYAVGRANARAAIPAVLDLIASGRLDADAVTTQKRPMDEAPRRLVRHVPDDETNTILTTP